MVRHWSGMGVTVLQLHLFILLGKILYNKIVWQIFQITIIFTRGQF